MGILATRVAEFRAQVTRASEGDPVCRGVSLSIVALGVGTPLLEPEVATGADCEVRTVRRHLWTALRLSYPSVIARCRIADAFRRVRECGEKASSAARAVGYHSLSELDRACRREFGETLFPPPTVPPGPGGAGGGGGRDHWIA